MAKPLTAPMIEKLKADPTKRVEVSDGLLPALRVVVQPSGAKSYAVRYRHRGRPAKLTIGPVGAVSLAEARDAARFALAEAARGVDPTAAKKASRAAASDTEGLVENVVEDFVKRHVGKLKSAPDVTRLLRVELVPWRGRRIEEIAKKDVIRLVDAVHDRGAPTTARLLLANLKSMFSWLVERDVVAESPCAGVKPPSEPVHRDRVLTDQELQLVLLAARGLGYPFGPMVMLLALTGARREEVAGMRWDELRLDESNPIWSLPPSRTKNKRAHDVPLSPTASDIIAALPKIDKSAYVFTTTGKTPVSGFSRAKALLDKRIAATSSEPMSAWRLHDLRRTFASGCAKLGVTLPVVEKCLNHVSGSFAGIVGVYQRHDFAAEKRGAFEMWGKHIEELLI